MRADIAFQNVTGTAGPFHSGESWGASWGDINNDGWPDIYVNNHRLVDSIYRNNRNGTFANVTQQIDLSGTLADHQAVGTRDTHGGVWGDFDNDGDQDLFVTAGRCCRKRFLVNQPAGLLDRTNALGFGAFVGGNSDFAGRSAVWLDYNGDGRLDLVMMTLGKNWLMEQRAGTFVDRSAAAGFQCNRTHYGQLSDLTGDNVLDLLCIYETTFPSKVYDISRIPFRDITARLPRVSNVVDTAIADFNNDQRPDIFAVRGGLRIADLVQVDRNHIEASLWKGAEKGFSFQSDGPITIDVASVQVGSPDRIFIGAAGRHPAAVPFTLSPADSSVQGIKPHNPNVTRGVFVGRVAGRWQVLHATANGFSEAYVFVRSAAVISGPTPINFPDTLDRPMAPALLMNGATGFVDRAAAAGLGPVQCGSAVAGDFDNDMDVDLYLVCRGGARNLPNRLYENRGNGTFIEVAGAGGAQGIVGAAVADGAGTGESVVTADYDRDGALDLFVTNGLGMQPRGVGGPDELFHNRGNANHWIELDLVGTASNRDAVGARVLAIAGGITQLREQGGGHHRWSQNHQRIHFGLGRNTAVDLKIFWPSGGLPQEHRNVAADQLYVVTERGGLRAAQ